LVTIQADYIAEKNKGG